MTRLLVLGLLEFMPLSGYDIQQHLKMTNAERWAGVLIGSIYHALNKMESEGLIELTGIERTGHRQKAVYQITEAGKAHLKTLVAEALTQPSVAYPTSLYSGLTFVEKLSKQQAQAALRQQAAELEQDYQSLERGREEKTAVMGKIPPMAELIFENMFAVVRNQQDLVRKAIELLNSEA